MSWYECGCCGFMYFATYSKKKNNSLCKSCKKKFDLKCVKDWRAKNGLHRKEEKAELPKKSG